MKKKILTLALALMLVMCAATPALAADSITSSGGSGSTTMNYTVTSSFSVTIPAGPINLETAEVTGNITVAEGKIGHGQKITVTATSANPGSETNNAFRIKNEQNRFLVYTVKKGNETGTEIFSGGVAAEFTAEQVNTGAEQALAFKLTGTAEYSGKYTDTITFAVTVVNA